MIEMPERIAKLPRDSRGYPIPYNIVRGNDGTPMFTINDSRKHMECLLGNLCPLCGEVLGRWKWFVGGPLSAFHPKGAYIDLPGHSQCERFALQTCPYLAAPRYLGRVDVIHGEKLPPSTVLVDDTMIPERPEFFVAVASRHVEIQADPESPLLPYVRPVRPLLGYEFWQHGKKIPTHRAMPILRGIFGADWELPKTEEA
jgi:hypothetical protein